MAQSLRSLPGGSQRSATAGSTRRCRACGATGHNRNNRRCPRYTSGSRATPAQPRVQAVPRGRSAPSREHTPRFQELAPGFFQFECVDSVVNEAFTPEAKRIVESVTDSVTRHLDVLPARRGGRGSDGAAVNPNDMLDMFLPPEVLGMMCLWTSDALKKAHHAPLAGVGEMKRWLGTFWVVAVYGTSLAEIETNEASTLRMRCQCVCVSAPHEGAVVRCVHHADVAVECPSDGWSPRLPPHGQTPLP